MPARQSRDYFGPMGDACCRLRITPGAAGESGPLSGQFLLRQVADGGSNAFSSDENTPAIGSAAVDLIFDADAI